MGIADKENRSGKAGNSLVEAEGDTQILESDSPLASNTNIVDPEDLCSFQNTVQHDETLPLDDEDLQFETELVEEVNNLEGATQLLDDFETQVVEDIEVYEDGCNQIVHIHCSQEESGTTEVLSEGEEVSVDMAVSSIMKEFSCEGTSMCEEGRLLERCSSSPLRLHEEGKKSFVVDSDASANEDYASGRLEPSSFKSENLSVQKNGFAKKSFTSVRSASLRSSGLAAARSMTPTSADREIAISKKKSTDTGSNPIERNSKTPPCGFNLVGDIAISLRVPGTEVDELDQDSEDSEENTIRIRNGTVRKLFVVDPSAEKDETARRFDYGIAGLSYVDSQEPGEQSQINALNIVDNYLKSNDIESSEEVDIFGRESVKDKSSPMSVLKGQVALAQKANPGVSAVKSGVFDWIDGHEDERGGDFFCKRKDDLLGNNDQLHKSKSEPRKLKHLTCRGKRDIGSNIEEKEARVHQKQADVVCSDSRFLLGRSRKWDGFQPTETKAKKNISKVLDKEGTEDPIGDVNGSQATYEVGFDTQLAAEAMEALCCAPSAEHNEEGLHNTSRGQRRNKICSKQVVRKRASPTSVQGRMKLSKRRKLNDAKSRNTTLQHMQLEPAEKPKERGMHKVYLTRSVVNSSKFTREQRRQGDGEICNSNMDISHASPSSSEAIVPPKQQTRQSSAKLLGKRPKNSHINNGKLINNPMDFSVAPKILNLQDNQNIEAQQKNEQHASSLTMKTWIYEKGKRTRRSAEKKNSEEHDHIAGSPNEKMQTSSSLNAVSPICSSDNPAEQFHKHGLSRFPSLRELTRLRSDAGPVSTLKEARRRRDMSSIRVLLSNHLSEDVIKQLKKILARLGVVVASSPFDATHFIADEFVRTRNMLETIALGKPVVTHWWLKSCAQASCYIDEQKYLLRDQKKEREIGFNMSVSLTRARQCPLLQGKRVFVTQNVKPSRIVVTALVLAASGQAVERIGRSTMVCDKMPDDLLVVSCEEDYAICVPLLEKGADVYSSELLLNGMVIQKLEFHRHRLFADHVKRTRSTIWLRNEQDCQFHPVPKSR
ncbi:hypothetical protein H6P81_002056 [Aristolochia fimbriata]|uniref:BRCT domain-containing protein n=1 Tax=Aristolochia fimbriata TaxID=158543 RepID=A0AAV7FD84_ARIFI|nr:hypothetical protein H6P81_002056 [Aristolochia fimbriata]